MRNFYVDSLNYVMPLVVSFFISMKCFPCSAGGIKIVKEKGRQSENFLTPDPESVLYLISAAPFVF